MVKFKLKIFESKVENLKHVKYITKRLAYKDM